MAVLRNRIGGLEDRFFATVFLGSGLLFVAMLFVAAAVFQALLDTFATEGSLPAQSETYAVARAMGYCAHEHVRREDGGRVHHRDLHDRSADGEFSHAGWLSSATRWRS